MLDRSKHEITMRNILDEIYSHKELAKLVGFKGGTACYFFYDLPRFSTDLDFNLLELSKEKEVYELLGELLADHGEIKDKIIKENTIFFLVSHTPGKSAIKIEVSTREIEKVNSYQLLEFYGTSVLVMKKEDIFANKLIALKHRRSATPRDLYDINYFFRKNWDISAEVVKKVTGENLLDYLKSLIPYIEENFKRRTIHQGIGELLETDAERSFVKDKLIPDTIKQIQIYIDSHE